MEVPRLGVQLELYLLAYTTTAAMQDTSHVCDLHHSSQQCWILNPLRKVSSTKYHWGHVARVAPWDAMSYKNMLIIALHIGKHGKRKIKD